MHHRAKLHQNRLNRGHPQSRNYITYRKDEGGGLSHRRRQHAQNHAYGSVGIFVDRQRQTHIHTQSTHHNTLQPLPRAM